MIYLGNIRRAGAHHIMLKAARAVLDQGQAALYIGKNGEAAAYSYLSPEYDRHARVHAKSLVGVYRVPDACARIPRAEQRLIEADIEAHLAALSKPSEVRATDRCEGAL